MEWKEFLASLVASLAWPLAVLAIVVMLRSQIVGLAGRLRFGHMKRFKAGASGVELEFFDEQLVEVDKALESDGELPVPPPSPDTATTGPATDRVAPVVEEDVLERLMDVSPQAATLNAYVQTEVGLRNLASRVGCAPGSVSEAVDCLHRQAIIGTSTYEAARGLMRTRSEILHGGQIDRDRALRFVALATEVQKRLERAAETLDP